MSGGGLSETLKRGVCHHLYGLQSKQILLAAGIYTGRVQIPFDPLSFTLTMVLTLPPYHLFTQGITFNNNSLLSSQHKSGFIYNYVRMFQVNLG